MRRVAAFLLMFAACLSAALTSARPAQAALPLQGGWETCDIQSDLRSCLTRLDAISAAGFKVIVAGSWQTAADPANISRYAEHARSLGVQIIWTFSDDRWRSAAPEGTDMLASLPGMTVRCGCTSNGELLNFIITFFNATGVTYGFYIADDSQTWSGPPIWPGTARVTEAIHRIAPQTRTIMGTWGVTTLGMYQQALTAVDLPAQEMYAAFGPQPDPSYVRRVVADGARAVQAAADRARRPSAFIMQSFSWADHLWDARASGVCSAPVTDASCPMSASRFPSRQEMLAARDAVLTGANPGLLLHYNFNAALGWAPGQNLDPEQRQPSADVQRQRWADTVAAAMAPEPRPKLKIKMPSRVRAGRLVRASTDVTVRGGVRKIVWRVLPRLRVRGCAQQCSLRAAHRGRFLVTARVSGRSGQQLYAQRWLTVAR